MTLAQLQAAPVERTLDANGIKRDSPVDLACKAHDLAYFQAEGQPNQASLILQADLALEQTIAGLTWSNLNGTEKTYSSLMAVAFDIKIATVDVVNVGIQALSKAALQKISAEGGDPEGKNFTDANGNKMSCSKDSAGNLIYNCSQNGNSESIISLGGNSEKFDLKGIASNNTISYEETDIVDSNRTVSSLISGQGDIANVSNAIITLADGANATVTGSGNKFTEGKGVCLAVSGTDTIQTAAGAVSVSGNSKITTGADGKTSTITEDVNSDGKTDLQEQVTVGAGGALTTDIKDLNLNGTLKDDTSVITSADGKSIVTTIDSDGDAKPNTVETVKTDATGVKTDDLQSLKTSGATQWEQVSTTPASGPVSVQISGQGDVFTGNNTNVIIATGGTAIVNGAGNHFAGGAGVTLTTTEADGTSLIESTSADGSTMTVREVKASVGFDHQQVLTGSDFNVQASVWTRADGQKFVDLTTNDGKALNNGLDKQVENGYNATTGALTTALTKQIDGTDVLMTLNTTNNTTSVQEFGNNADGSVNWASLRDTQTLQGLASDVQASVWVRADGQKFVDLTTNDGKALNNGLDKLVEDGYNATTGALATALTEQTNGTDVVMTLNTTNNTTSVQEFANNADGSVNWASLRDTQTLQGLASDVQASVWVRADGQKFVDLTTNDGKALNNGLDKLVEDGYNATTGALATALTEQTNGTDVVMTLNTTNNTTSVQEFANNADGSVNWASLRDTQT
ncbi:hypothetical protein AAKU55_004251, partial [Oxalobacteraceae bacterium GrIS 1.11]